MKHILTILSIVFSLSIANAQKLIDKVVAIVGDKAVLYSEIEGQKIQAKQQGLTLTKADEALILEDLMFQKLLLHQAEIDSIEVSEQQVSAELDQRIQYFAAQIGGIAELEKFYEKSIEEIKDEFFEQIENRLKTQQMEQKITEDVSVSPKEIKTFFNKIPSDSVPEIGSKIAVSQIVIRPEVTYEEKKKIKTKLTELRNKIIGGELNFDIAAEFYSEDPGSKSQGGYFGWVTRGTFVPEFDAVAFRVPLNEVSEIFETQYGYHITLIEERRGEQFKGKHILLSFKVGDLQLSETKRQLIDIKKEINENKITWEAAVLKHSDDDQTKGSEGILYNEAAGSMLWDMRELDPQIFAGINQLKVNEISEPQLMQTRDGAAYRILKLNEQTSPHKANLKDDYQLIQSFALQNKKAKAIEQWTNTKIKDVYIKLDEDYKEGSYQYNWLNE
ncbi:MAG: peptidylprolyl isomerase [Flavobacteriales bacterium]|jgi:peptidyl-prolyl cis-trans isomerase SurA|nr:peptidylprolyl isomerase [Flavobacteriales bacterium]